MATFKRTLLVSALCVATAAGAFAAAPETTISVEVNSPSNKPVENAAVILDFLGSRNYVKLGRHQRVHWEMHTDLHGRAQFPPVPQGTLQLQVVAKTYQTFGKRFEVDSDQKEITVVLQPPQKQYSAHPPLKPKDDNAPQPQQ